MGVLELCRDMGSRIKTKSILLQKCHFNHVWFRSFFLDLLFPHEAVLLCSLFDEDYPWRGEGDGGHGGRGGGGRAGGAGI